LLQLATEQAGGDEKVGRRRLGLAEGDCASVKTGWSPRP
ncbi:hypothetical protein LDZ95_08990, partial [Pseudomonas aeruginosa]|nr:hypothetical protein [Pseudomonas aeruginosa]